MEITLPINQMVRVNPSSIDLFPQNCLTSPGSLFHMNFRILFLFLQRISCPILIGITFNLLIIGKMIIFTVLVLPTHEPWAVWINSNVFPKHFFFRDSNFNYRGILSTWWVFFLDILFCLINWDCVSVYELLLNVFVVK